MKLKFIFAGLILSLFIFPSQYVSAKPLMLGGGTAKTPTYPKNSTLNVFVQADPDGKGRSQKLKEGIERWKKPLQERMITLNVSIGNVPSGTQNPIFYRWVQDGSMLGDTEIGPGTNDAVAVPIQSSDGKSLVGGRAFVRRGLKNDTATEMEALRNVGEHEIIHLIGLADDKKGAVTNHVQSGNVRPLNDEDLKELNFLYGTSATGGVKKTSANFQHVGGDAMQGFFEYQLDFNPANLAPILSDPEHVAFIALAIDPGLVTGIDVPPGWISLIPDGNPISINDSFFDDYMEDGFFDPEPWDPLTPTTYLALRTSAEEALKDGLLASFDPGLTLHNPSLNFKLFTNDRTTTGLISVWGGGDFQTVIGPVPIPEPSSLFLFAAGVLGLLIRRRI